MDLRLISSDLPRPVVSGEVVRLPAGNTLTLELQTRIPTADWAGEPNRVDLMEFIGITPEGASVIRGAAPSAEGTLRHEITVPREGIIIRARGRRVVEDGPDLLFYTNPIVVRTANTRV
jgi:hypothetical protein